MPDWENSIRMNIKGIRHEEVDWILVTQEKFRSYELSERFYRHVHSLKYFIKELCTF